MPKEPKEQADTRQYLALLLAPSQAGELLGVSGTWVKELCRRGELLGYETSLGWLIDPQSADRLLEARIQEAKRGVADKRRRIHSSGKNTDPVVPYQEVCGGLKVLS